MHISLLTVSLAACSFASAALGQPVSCDFDSDTYHLGTLSGQNGWSVMPSGVPAAAASVVTSPRHAGDQAARFNQAVYTSEFYADWACSAALAPYQTSADFEWRMMITLGTGFGWVVELRASNGARLGWLWIDGGNMWYSTWGTEPQLASGFMTADTWHQLKMSMDWQARTTEFFMDGQSIGLAGWRLSPSRDIGVMELRAVVGGSTDTAGLDSIIVTPRGGCAGDFNADGSITSQDFFDYLNEFFAAGSPADFNLDGMVNSQDFFDYLSAFFAGC